jgi:hypothetical protein
MRYPIDSASNIPGSGNAFYLFLLDNVHIPAKSTHTLWFKTDDHHTFHLLVLTSHSKTTRR